MPTALKTNKVRQEKVHGNPIVFAGQQRSVLASFDPDEIDSRVNKETLDKLLFDPEISASENFLFEAIFSDGVAFIPSVTDEHEDFEAAKDMAALFTDSYLKPKKSLTKTVKEAAKEAFHYGTKLSEIVARLDTVEGVQVFVLDRLNAKPHDAVGFVVDRFNNTLGIVGADSANQYISTGVFTNTGQTIPRDKFLIFSFEQKDNDPRGLSQVRAAVQPFCRTQETLIQRREFQRREATLHKYATVGEKAGEVVVRDAAGNVEIDAVTKLPKTIPATEHLASQGENLRNHALIVGPHGTTFGNFQGSGDGSLFERSLDYDDGLKRAVILLQKLATGEAKKQTQASTGSQSDKILNRRIKSFRRDIEDQIYNDLVVPFILLNHGEDSLHLAPKVSLGEVAMENKNEQIGAYVGAGWSLHSSQQTEVDDLLDMPTRAEDWQEQDAEKAAAITDANEPIDEGKEKEEDKDNKNDE